MTLHAAPPSNDSVARYGSPTWAVVVASVSGAIATAATALASTSVSDPPTIMTATTTPANCLILIHAPQGPHFTPRAKQAPAGASLVRVIFGMDPKEVDLASLGRSGLRGQRRIYPAIGVRIRNRERTHRRLPNERTHRKGDPGRGLLLGHAGLDPQASRRAVHPSGIHRWRRAQRDLSQPRHPRRGDRDHLRPGPDVIPRPARVLLPDS